MELIERLAATRILGLPLKFVAEARANGLKTALFKTARFISRERAYRYVENFDPSALQVELESLRGRPLISVVMPVHNAVPRWLDVAVTSVRRQIYPDWELCIADDRSTDEGTLGYLRALNHPRIKVVFLADNLGISGASNAAIGLARGEYVAFMDHDDSLARDALFEVARVIGQERPQLIYSDEDNVVEGLIGGRDRYVSGHHKPDFSPDLLLSHNYITHLMVVQRGFLDQIGYFRGDFDGAQDYDLVLRATERATSICHIRKVLYHWRRHRRSTSARVRAKPYTVEAGKRALREALERRGVVAAVEETDIANFFRVRRKIKGQPLVSIIVPFRDRATLLKTCVETLLAKTTYRNFELLGIDNGSSEEGTREAIQQLQALDDRVAFHCYDVPFNYSRINNHAATLARGQHLVLLNNDIEIISPGWIEALLEHSQRIEVGAVGGRLYYPSGKVQHGGVIVGIAGFAGHAHRHWPNAGRGYFNRLSIVQNLSAVTGAMLMVKRALYLDLGGLDETHLGTSLNDVDFCLRLREKGFLNVFTPYAEAYHHESVSRGYENTPEKQRRFADEVAYFQRRHERILAEGDPYYNPNLTLNFEDFGYGEETADIHKRYGFYRRGPESNGA